MEGTVIKAVEDTVTRTAEDTVTETVVTRTVEAMTIIVKAMTSQDRISECKEDEWTRRYL